MHMKKILCLLSAVMLLLAVGTGCGKKAKTESSTTEAESTTQFRPEFVEEGDHTVFDVPYDDDEYEKNYLNSDGDAIKTEHYKNQKLTYYYTISEPDKDGVTTQKYYSSDGKLFAVYDANGFKDAAGKTLDEESVQKLIDSYNK